MLTLFLSYQGTNPATVNCRPAVGDSRLALLNSRSSVVCATGPDPVVSSSKPLPQAHARPLAQHTIQPSAVLATHSWQHHLLHQAPNGEGHGPPKIPCTL